MPSALNDVKNAILSMLNAIPEMTTVTIDDSGEPSSRSYDSAVIVGDDGDPDTEVVSSFEQEWANLAHNKRSERGTIPCAAVAQSGSTKITGSGDRAAQLLAYFEEALEADPTLGGTVFTAELVNGTSKPIQNSQGSAIIIPFTVQYWTHI